MSDKECICIKGRPAEEGTVHYIADPKCPLHGDDSAWAKSWGTGPMICPNPFCVERETTGVCLESGATKIFCSFLEKYLEHIEKVKSLVNDLNTLRKITRS